MELIATLFVFMICVIGAAVGVFLVLAFVSVTAISSLFVWTVRKLRGPSRQRIAIDGRPIIACRNALCGATNPESAHFCRRCGSAMGMAIKRG